MRRVENLISVCARQDAEVWPYVARNIETYIDSERYWLIVPNAEADLFRTLTPDRFHIVGEDDLLRNFTLDYVRAKMPAASMGRAGWYYQQLLKLLALTTLPAAPDELLLLWDADTMPLRRLNFTLESGALIFYRGIEHHRPYFDTIRRLLGLEKQVDFSFIAQCFPIYRCWIDEMARDIETAHRKNWIDAIIDNTDLGEHAGFSEYETMGAYLVEHHRSEMAVNLSPWERFGYSRGLDPKALCESASLGREYAFVSFESWDRPADGGRRQGEPPCETRIFG